MKVEPASPYSYLSALIRSSLEAAQTGQRPNRSPIAEKMPNAAVSVQMLM